jgi:hypothetical protein
MQSAKEKGWLCITGWNSRSNFLSLIWLELLYFFSSWEAKESGAFRKFYPIPEAVKSPCATIGLKKEIQKKFAGSLGSH